MSLVCVCAFCLNLKVIGIIDILYDTVLKCVKMVLYIFIVNKDLVFLYLF